MKTALGMALLFSFGVNAQTVLECKPRDGKFEVSQTVIADLVILKDQVLMTQYLPVFRNVTFDVAKAESTSTRTGAWTTYRTEIPMEEVITLKIEGSGKVRRSYLEMESALDAPEHFLEMLPMNALSFKLQTSSQAPRLG